MNTPTLPPVALIAGPTASGKSAIAMALARLTPSVIINADSMQVYRDLRIVTARPDEDDTVAVPHRLYGYIDGAEACSAARWAADARAAITATHAADRLPVVVGGTGLYIRTLLDGIAPVPEIDPVVRAQVRDLAVTDAYAALSCEDPVAAARLAPADATRIARALEVVRATGRPLGDWHAARTGGIADAIRLAPLVLLPPREALFARCDARFAAMMEAGQDEVAALVARGLDPALPVMRAIGVRAIADMLAGKVTADDAYEAGALATRQYAKRQFTWFANQTPAVWTRVPQHLDCENISNIAIKLHDDLLTA